jgi:hypothetical protein
MMLLSAKLCKRGQIVNSRQLTGLLEQLLLLDSDQGGILHPYLASGPIHVDDRAFCFNGPQSIGYDKMVVSLN